MERIRLLSMLRLARRMFECGVVQIVGDDIMLVDEGYESLYMRMESRAKLGRKHYMSFDILVSIDHSI